MAVGTRCVGRCPGTAGSVPLVLGANLNATPWSAHVDCSHGELARKKLIDGLRKPCVCKECVFDDVEISMDFPNCSWIANGDGQAQKAIIAPQYAFPSAGCVVYGAGIASDSSFEESMSAHCEVHAFDCTVHPSRPQVTNKPFTFHQTCLGDATHSNSTRGGLTSTLWRDANRGNPDSELHFLPLREVVKSFGHRQVDLLKFDIEGYEWELIEKQVLAKGGFRPLQMAFELHTEFVPDFFVPPAVVRHRGKAAVNRLFLALHDLGYRVVSKQLNLGEISCAEFVVALGCADTRGADHFKSKPPSQRGGCLQWAGDSGAPHVCGAPRATRPTPLKRHAFKTHDALGPRAVTKPVLGSEIQKYRNTVLGSARRGQVMDWLFAIVLLVILLPCMCLCAICGVDTKRRRTKSYAYV